MRTQAKIRRRQSTRSAARSFFVKDAKGPDSASFFTQAWTTNTPALQAKTDDPETEDQAIAGNVDEIPTSKTKGSAAAGGTSPQDQSAEPIQAKLTVGEPGDPYEREADTVAERLLSASDVTIQRQVGPEEEEEELQAKSLPGESGLTVRRQPEEKNEEMELMQAKGKATATATGGVDVTSNLSTQLQSLRGGGQQVPGPMSRFFGSRMGHDFSSVRVHADSSAASLARRVNARAFTSGRDVVFGAGEFSPGTTSGKKLLAHELTHVLQQGQTSNDKEGQGLIQRVATDPVVSILPQISLSAGVGRTKTNNVADVRLIQDRLLALNFLSTADHAAETPAAGATGTVPVADLTATIAAIEAFQSEVLGFASPDGDVDSPGGTLRRLNSAIPRPTATEITAVSTARTGITETVTHGVTITAPVGAVPNADVFAGNANRPADVSAVQTRLVQLGFLASGHSETPAGIAVVTPIALTGAVGDGGTNNAADVRQVQDRLLALGHLSAADHATEQPAPGTTGTIPEANLVATITAIRAFQAASGFSSPDGNIGAGGTTHSLLNTDSVPSAALTHTKNAIFRFQRDVRFFRPRGDVSGGVTNRVINTGDATIDLLNRVSSYREEFSSGEVFNFRDFVRSRHTRSTGGTSVIGTEAPSALPASEFTAVGLTPAQTAALRFVSSHEGNFDALNTFDVARVSFGFVQFAGGRGLPPFMALLKSRKPATFASMFQTFGIDVEFNVVGGNIENPVIVVIDPATSTVLRGTPAEAFIRDSQRLSAVFMRAGHNIEVQRVQIEAATRDYVLPALGKNVSFTADIVEVLAAPGGAVTATHAGAAARAFRATPAFATLNTAGRIRERTAATNERIENLLSSEQGLAVLMDRAIQEGVGGGSSRIRAAIRWVADQHGLTDIAGITALENEVLQQVADDLTADIDITATLERARTHLNTLYTAAGATGATVAGVIANAAVGSAHTEVDRAIAALSDKSPDSARTTLESDLPTQRARMNFTPAPATTAALRTLIGDIRDELQRIKPDRRGNAAGFRRRVQDILGSTLAAPTAPAPPAAAPAPTP